MYPDEVTRPAVPRNSFSVAFVNCLVGLPEGGLEIAEVLQVVKQRPDDFIGVTVVKFVALCLAQCHRYYFVSYTERRFAKGRCRDFACDAGPANPDPTALAQHCSHGGHEASD